MQAAQSHAGASALLRLDFFLCVSTRRALATSNIHRPGNTKGLPAATSSRSPSAAGLDCEETAQETPTEASATNPSNDFNGGPYGRLREFLCRGAAVPPGGSPSHREDS